MSNSRRPPSGSGHSQQNGWLPISWRTTSKSATALSKHANASSDQSLSGPSALLLRSPASTHAPCDPALSPGTCPTSPQCPSLPIVLASLASSRTLPIGLCQPLARTRTPGPRPRAPGEGSSAPAAPALFAVAMIRRVLAGVGRAAFFLAAFIAAIAPPRRRVNESRD